MVFGGDLNTDLSRASPHNQALSEFVRNYQMGVCIEKDHANVHISHLMGTHPKSLLVIYLITFYHVIQLIVFTQSMYQLKLSSN